MAHPSALYYALEHAKVKTYDSQWFIPITTLHHVITESAVRNALQTSYYLTTDVDALVRKICQMNSKKSEIEYWGKKWTLEWLKDLNTSCKRIFAILVLINKARADIVKPIVDSLCDLDLPLAGQGPDCLLSSRHDSSIRFGSATDMSCFHTSDWTVQDRKRFYQVQWSLLAPVLEKQRGYNIYPNLVILPWGKPRSNRLASRGDLLRTKIYRGHHKFPDSKQNERYTVALKLVNAPTKSFNDKKTLTRALRALGDNNPHIVELLAEFYKGGNYHLLFPWPQGTLRDLWAMTPEETVQKFKLGPHALKRWLLEQCLGIGRAFAQMHDLSYAHGRIRPENIFWCYTDDSQPGPLSMGHLKVFDDVVDARPAGSLGYLKGDIWSLGCLYLEFITWYVMGSVAVDKPGPRPEELEPREPSRGKFFMWLSAMSGQDGAGSVEVMSIYEAKLRLVALVTNKRCCPAICAFVNLILASMLSKDGNDRVACQEVVSVLEQVMSQVQE